MLQTRCKNAPRVNAVGEAYSMVPMAHYKVVGWGEGNHEPEGRSDIKPSGNQPGDSELPSTTNMTERSGIRTSSFSGVKAV